MKSLALSFALAAAAMTASAALPAAGYAASYSGRVAAAHAARPAGASAYSQANAYLKHGKYPQAISAFKQAIKNHDHVAQSWGGLGAAYLDTRQYRPAFAAYQAGVKAAPRTPDYYYGAAYAAVSSRAQDLATFGVSYAQDYASMRKNDVKGYIVEFLAYSALLQAKGELSAAQQIVRLRPHLADSYNYLGIALANSRKLRPAVSAFSRAIQIRSNVTQFWVNRGGVQVVLHNFKAGLSDYQHALSLSTSPVERKYIQALIKGVHHDMHK